MEKRQKMVDCPGSNHQQVKDFMKITEEEVKKEVLRKL